MTEFEYTTIMKTAMIVKQRPDQQLRTSLPRSAVVVAVNRPGVYLAKSTRKKTLLADRAKGHLTVESRAKMRVNVVLNAFVNEVCQSPTSRARGRCWGVPTVH